MGGVLLFWWSATHFEQASTIIESIPAINHSMLMQVYQALSEQGLFAMLLEPLSGIPYKTYAIQAAHVGISIGWFLLASVPARLIRFVAITTLSYYLSQLISQKTNLNSLSIILTIWLLFYCGYFYTMGV